VLVRAYAWLALLQRTGVINQLLQIRHHRAPAGAVHNTFGTVVATVHIRCPHGSALYATCRIRTTDQAGATSGQPRAYVLAIFLPLSLPGVSPHDLVFVLCLASTHARAARRRPTVMVSMR